MWNLDWTVSYEQVKNETDWIYSWARTPYKNPNEVLGSWGWFPDWRTRLLNEYWQYVYGGLLLTGLNFIALLFKQKQREEKSLFVLYVPLIAGILFWFITVPDWRFLGAIPQLYVALSGFLFIRYIMPSWITYYVEKFPASLKHSFFGLAILLLMIKSVDLKNLPLSGWHTIPLTETKEQITSSGLRVFVPTSGDQCWDSDLPCTPYFYKGLNLRERESGEKELGNGFNFKK